MDNFKTHGSRYPGSIEAGHGDSADNAAATFGVCSRAAWVANRSNTGTVKIYVDGQEMTLDGDAIIDNWGHSGTAFRIAQDLCGYDSENSDDKRLYIPFMTW